MNSPIRRSRKRIYIWAIVIVSFLVVRVFIDLLFPDYLSSNDSFLRNGPCEIIRINSDQTLLIEQSSLDSESENKNQIKCRLHGIELIDFNEDFESFEARILQFQESANLVNGLRIELGKKRVAVDQIALIFLFSGDKCVNEELIRSGLATPKIEPGMSAYRALRLRKALQESIKKDVEIGN